MSRKLPAFMFYTGDWLKDTRRLSLSAKGAWIELIVAMWDTAERGTTTDDLDGYARLLGCSAEQAQSCIDEISKRKVCDREDLPDGKIRITCRRMIAEEKERENGRDRQNNYRNKNRPERDENETSSDGDLSRESNGGCNGEVTPLSHASSSSSSLSNSLSPGGRGKSSKKPEENAREGAEMARKRLAELAVKP